MTATYRTVALTICTLQRGAQTVPRSVGLELIPAFRQTSQGISIMQSWIPKRAVGCSVYLPPYEVPLLDDKPTTSSSSVYQQVSPIGLQPYTIDGKFHRSEYKATMSLSVPQDYLLTRQERVHRPRGRIVPIGDQPHHRWETTYSSTLGKTAHAVTCSVRIAKQVPSSLFAAKTDTSQYSRDFPADPQSLHRPANYLLSGTSKGTPYLPGFAGYLPKTSTNPIVQAYAQTPVRQDHKSSRNFHVDMPGYTGHRGENDFLSRQITSETSYGDVHSTRDW